MKLKSTVLPILFIISLFTLSIVNALPKKEAVETIKISIGEEFMNDSTFYNDMRESIMAFESDSLPKDSIYIPEFLR